MSNLLYKIARLFSKQNRLRIFLRKQYIRYKSEKQVIDKREAKKCLADIHNILTNLNIISWLDAGTCLGAIRERDFIEHDFDIDLGVFMKDAEKSEMIINNVLKAGFTFKNRGIWGSPEYFYSLCFERNGIGVDIVFVYEKSDCFTLAGWTAEGPYPLRFDKRFFTELQTIEFLGMKMLVPNHVYEYLEVRYGDWRTPCKDWDWRTDPICRDDGLL